MAFAGGVVKEAEPWKPFALGGISALIFGPKSGDALDGIEHAREMLRNVCFII